MGPTPSLTVLARVVALALVTLAAPGVGQGQTRVRPGASSLHTISAPSVLRPSLAFGLTDTVPRPHRPTYWREGALLGGLIAGVLLTSFAAAVCNDPDSGGTGPCWDNVLLGAFIGVAGGGTLGALAGGLFEKPSREQSDTSASRR